MYGKPLNMGGVSQDHRDSHTSGSCSLVTEPTICTAVHGVSPGQATLQPTDLVL